MDDNKTDLEFMKAVQNRIKSLQDEIDSMKEQQKNPPITKEDIMKVQNRSERQKLMSEHMDLFKTTK